MTHESQDLIGRKPESGCQPNHVTSVWTTAGLHRPSSGNRENIVKTATDLGLLPRGLPARVRLKDRIFRRPVIAVLVGVCVFAGALAQSSETHKKKKSSSKTAEITRFFVEESKKDSKYKTGPLHIVYDDGTEVVKSLPLLEASTEKETVFNDVGFSDVHLAADRQTLGWTIDVENCCTSYPIPLRVVIFRHGKVLRTFEQGQMVWSWMFFLGGERLAAAFGPTHGPEVGDYRLYNVKSGKLISEVFGDEDTQSLSSDAPEWAKLLEEQLHNK